MQKKALLFSGKKYSKKVGEEKYFDAFTFYWAWEINNALALPAGMLNYESVDDS